MNDAFTVRAATPEDIGGLLRLLAQLFAIEADFQFDARRQRRGLEMLLASSGAVVMVAEGNGSVVGMATAQVVISTAEGGPSLLVEDVVVEKAWQKKGIGTRLLQALAAWGRGRGSRRLQLLADRDNREALAFYQNGGWKHTQLICLRSFTGGDEP